MDGYRWPCCHGHHRSSQHGCNAPKNKVDGAVKSDVEISGSILDERSLGSGPFRGVPFLIKDVFGHAMLQRRCQRVLANVEPRRSCSSVVLDGKRSMPPSMSLFAPAGWRWAPSLNCGQPRVQSDRCCWQILSNCGSFSALCKGPVDQTHWAEGCATCCTKPAAVSCARAGLHHAAQIPVRQCSSGSCDCLRSSRH
jgi:hypothetical protein